MRDSPPEGYFALGVQPLLIVDKGKARNVRGRTWLLALRRPFFRHARTAPGAPVIFGLPQGTQRRCIARAEGDFEDCGEDRLQL